MQKINYQFFIFIFLIVSCNSFGQEDVCECCSYASLQYKHDYDEIFTPSLIKSEGILEVMIYNKTKALNDSVGTDKYREAKFRFNRNGLVKSKTQYNRKGKPHSIYYYKRNKAGKVYQRIYSYLDSLEQQSSFFGKKDIVDFKYDTKSRLIKIKDRDYNGKLVPDNKTKYTLFEYDEMDRVIKRTFHHQYTGKSSIAETIYSFSNTSFTSVYQSKYDGKLSLSGKTTYNKDWKEILDKSYNETLKNDAFTSNFTYDNQGRLMRFESAAGPGAGSECPDGGSFVDFYKYDEKGFLQSINHTFKDNTCEMTFVYSKHPIK